ncbi:LacI family DNA-binding transcriptional regulator [Pleionea mediterranea]|uniref:LacI family transcriptional regulator n=1 Tax=Pleionea mediterranea TaxID=523701 RepID=A0A316FHT3_9GAMM|nr:LacI family DNA-binding transcriptional regulator [Pleionea mediterranea]PWK47370.1 LacI family transcriptional regulator [Pleionea mediterranea]
MNVTINDVAKHAGVSMKTVSRVINREPSVKQATYDKVMASVTALNYQPNQAARNLASTKSYIIGFVYSNPNAYYVIDMQNGMLSECRKRGYELLIHPCQPSSGEFIEEITSLVKHSRIAGLVLTPPYSEMPSVVKALQQLDIKFVRIISGSKPSKSTQGCVLVDDKTAAFEITQHLIDLGHEKIGFLCGGKEHKSTEARLSGYEQALAENRIRQSKQLVLDGDYSFDSGVEGAKKLLSRKNRPTAIFAANDEIAAGALFAARLSGVAIPEELSIVGFEDSPFSRQTWPKLTTAHQPNNTIAETAASMLIDMLQNTNDKQVQSQCIRFCPELVVRDSSARLLN